MVRCCGCMPKLETFVVVSQAFDTQVPCAKLGHTSCEVSALGGLFETAFMVIGSYSFCNSTYWK